ncbi:titin-like [Maniola jurtina]|uniref:titin-like n=1 Tax=Maniola jurtina TaxID=191418 RepID=UPI001E687DD8|nr:titin-like [Maniola jurtina]
MKFYLVYKNHGLYDPILDDSEDIDAPIGPDDLDQGINVQELRQVQIETKESQEKTETDYSILESSTPYRPFSAGGLEEPIILNLNYKDVFPELSLDELPPQTKYKLPVSEQYDPEGKRIKEKAVYDKNIVVDFEKIKKLAERQHIKQTKDVSFKKEVCDKSLFEKTEKVEVSKQETKHLNILEESELRKIKQTAKQVIEDSLNKAVSLANQLKSKSDYKLSESSYEENKISSQTHKLSKETCQRSNLEKRKLVKKVSFEDDYIKVHEEKISSDEATKREVRVADEVKKFETFDIQMDSKLNVEERKLLTQRDIEEAIEAGTVRQRTGMFKTGTDKIMASKLDQKTFETVKSDVKTNLELAKQRVYKIGLQIIPRIRATVQSSRQSAMLLKRFLLQMTKVMITLYRFIPKEKRYNFTKSKGIYEGKKESREYIHKIDSADEVVRSSVVEEIKKPKLSGAKIAQIEGLKPAELTDRMNIVISEFLRKSGKEEQFDKKESHRSQTSTSKSESETQDEFLNDTSFSERTFDESHTGDEFLYSSSFSEKTFDKSKRRGEFPDRNRKLFEEMYETKTRSYEMREMKEEKRYSESKTSKYDSKLHSYETETATRDDVSVPLTYIAIVEAHVYTNKNAIFEEQMRRMSESMKQTELAESGIIYYRCEVSVFYRQFREPSLPPTVVIESIEEIPSEQVFEEEKQELLQTCETGYEDTAKKLAVQKISEIIEPLLKIKEVKSVNIKQAYPAIETPLKLISEQTTVTMEKEENILQESKLIETSLISIEKPVKSVVETSEIKEEERSGFVEIQEIEERKPRPILEPSQAIAETTEIFIEEEAVGMLDIAQPIAQLPQPVKIERAIKSVAETSEVFVDEANIDVLEVSKGIGSTPRYTIADNLRSIAETMIAIIEEPKSENTDTMKITGETVKVGVDEIIASEVFEVFPEEPVYEEVIQTEMKRRESEVFLERSLLVLPEITLTTVEEPICEELVISKALSKEAKVDINAKVVAEITEVSLNEKEQDTFDVVKITAKEPGARKEESVLSVGETQTVLPFEPPTEMFDTKKLTNQQASIAIEELKATETTFIQVEEPKLAFEINEHLKQQARVEVEELKSATVSSVTVEEPKQETVETHKVNNKEANTDMEASLLTVAENTIVLPEGPHHGNLEIPQLETKRPKTLIEGGLIVAETMLVSPTSPEGDFNLIEKINQQANISMEESKAITTSFVHLEEPKEEKFDQLQSLEKQPQTFLQDSLLPVATTLEVLLEGPKDDVLITPKPAPVKAVIDIEEFKTASVTSVSVEEPKNESLETFSYKEKESESLLEKPVFNVAEKFDIVPEGPLYDKLETPDIPHGKANIIVEEIKPLTVSFVTPNEPREKSVDVPQVKDIKPQFIIEDRFLPVVEATSIVPDEPKDSFTVVSVTNEQANIKIKELKGTSITVVYSEEPKEEDIKLPIIEAKQQQPVLEAVHLTAAETSLILPEESKITFDVAKTTNQQAHIEVIEQKAAEANLVFPLDSRDKDLIIEEIIEKTPKTLVERPVLTAAENFTVILEEKVEELPKSIKPTARKATIYLKGLKLPSTIILCSEEPSPVETELTAFSKSLSKQGRLTYEAHTATAIAESTFVNVNIAKEEIIDVSKYTVELAEDHVEKEAFLKTKKEITVDIKDIDWSSASSTISSAPSSPFIQEYVFGIATGHEYRVQSPQETELHIVQPAKDLYGVDSANTSYTLCFEAAYEEEKEILHMEEFSDVVKKNQFWISDVKTVETIESSDARIHLVDITMGAEAHKASQKYVTIQDSTVGIKSRSQSFDTSADFELSLQSLAQSEARETQISNVEAVATIDLKSERSFKTVEDVESQAKVNIKSKSAKAYSAQSVDVSYGLTLENEIVVDGQSMELDAQSSLESKTASKSTKRMVKKGTKSMALKTSETDIKASYDYEAGMNVESMSVSKESFAAMEGGIESRVAAKKSYAAMEESVKSRSIAEASYATMEANLESNKVSEAGYSAMEGKLELTGVSKGSYADMDASLQSRSISKGSYASTEANLEASTISEAYSSKQASLESKTCKSIEMDARQKMSSETTEERQKLSLQTDLKGVQVTNGVKSPSPEDIPSTPLRDVYIFRLRTPAPEETTFVPRDCSFTPESIHEDDFIIVNGMVPHIDTKIVRVLYSPPLETPPTSPVRKVEPVFTKPGLRGGSETPEVLKSGSKSGSCTPKFTKEEILEIGRKSALLASEIDKTIRSIEEYKESVGIRARTDMTETKGEERLNEKEKTTKKSLDNAKLEKDENPRKSVDTKKAKISTEKHEEQNADSKTELDIRKEENVKSRKSMLSRFSQKSAMEPNSIAKELLKNVESMVDPKAPVEQQLEQMRAQMAALAELPNVINQKLESLNKKFSQFNIKQETTKKEQRFIEVKKHKERQQIHEYYQQQFQKHREKFQPKQDQQQFQQNQDQNVNPKHSVEITELEPDEEVRNNIQIRVTKPSLTGEELDVEKREELRRSLEDLRMRKSVSPAKDQACQTTKKDLRAASGKPEPAFGPGPVERPIYLPGGRRWKMSEYDEDQITETLVGQAEVIKGRAMGVNFKKFEKPPPGVDHLKHSEVYRAVHNLEDEPLKKVQMFRPTAFAESDIRELEVLVDFGPKADTQVIEKTINSLKAQDGVTQAVYKDGAVMVETTLPSAVVLDMVAKTSGKRAVLQGFGESQSAVAMISSQSCCKSQVLGVIRFQQSTAGPLVGDGSVHGLTPGLHGLHVRHTGDLSMGCESLGEHYNPYNSPHGGPNDPVDKRHAGDLGNIIADEEGRATFRIVDDLLQIHEIVGRSIAVTERRDDLGRGSSLTSKIDGDSGMPVACGIIARSAGIFQNPKRICACDGVVVWDERDKPLAGKGRREKPCCEKKDENVKMCCKV